MNFEFIAGLLLTGIAGGFLAGLLGIGGGIVMMPVLRFLYHLSPPLAVGVNITAVIFTTGFGSLRHFQMKQVDRFILYYIIPAGLAGDVAGSFLFTRFCGHKIFLDLAMGIIFSLVAARMIYEGVRNNKELINYERLKVSNLAMVKLSSGFVAGLIPGLLGIGAGAILVPILVYILKRPIKIAIGTSLACFFTFAIISSLFKLCQGVVNFPMALIMGIGAAAGSYFGASLTRSINPRTLKTLFGIIFFYVALKYILISFGISI